MEYGEKDYAYMRRALELADMAADRDEVPVGAVIVDPASHTIIAEGYNRPISLNDPTAHAEIIALRAAAHSLQNYRLTGLDLYVTLEPCSMCAGAIANARIRRVVFGADDIKGGAVISGTKFFDQPTCHWHPEILGGVLAGPCSDILKAFFRARRKITK
tara:strand:- start:7204 stop:7680 length:477 start_codon:yes stop_codon:yes gene_type:complete